MNQHASTAATGNPPSGTDAAVRMAVIDAMGMIADLTRDGLPLVSWSVHAHGSWVEVSGQAGQVRGGATPAEVRDTVRAYAEHFGVEADERDGKRQVSIHARTEIRGLRVDVWGVTAVHDDADGAR